MSIASEITRLQNASADIAAAITAKGVTVPAGSKFADYPALIAQIGNDRSALYIETAGDAYIDTGIVQTSLNFEWALDMEWTGDTLSSFESFFAYMKDGGVIPRSGVHKYSSKWMHGTNSTKSTTTTPDNQRHTIRMTNDSSSRQEQMELDGSAISSVNTPDTSLESNTIPFFLGARNRNGSIDNPAKARFYSLNYKEFSDAAHTVLVQEYNFVPHWRLGVFGMLETVSDTFLPSIGGSPFTGVLIS